MKKINHPTFYEVKRRRVAMGLSQIDLARLCGYDQSMVSKFESGKQSISYKAYFDLLSALRYDVVFTKREEKHEEN